MWQPGHCLDYCLCPTLPPATLYYAFKKGCVSNAFSCLASLCFALRCNERDLWACFGLPFVPLLLYLPAQTPNWFTAALARHILSCHAQPRRASLAKNKFPVPWTTCQLNFNLGNLNNLCGSPVPAQLLLLRLLLHLVHILFPFLSVCLTACLAVCPSACLSRFLHCLGTFLVQANWHSAASQVLRFHRRFLMPFSAYFMCSLAPGTVGRRYRYFRVHVVA